MPQPRRTRGGGYEWSIVLNLELAPTDHLRAWFIAGLESSNSWAMFGCFSKCDDEDHLSAFIFSAPKKTAARERRRRCRQNCMRNGEDTCFHNYEKRNFFSLFLRRCIPHHNFCSLFAVTRCVKRSDAEPNNDGWQLWNVFFFDHEFSPFLFSLSPINTPDKGSKRFAVRFSEKPAQHVASASKNDAENEFRRVSVIEAFANLEFLISIVSLTE